MIFAKDIKKIAEATKLKRDSNSLTSYLIEAIDENILFMASKYGESKSSYNYGKTTLRKIKKENSLSENQLLDFEKIEKYYMLLGYDINYEQIGTIEDRDIVISCKNI